MDENAPGQAWDFSAPGAPRFVPDSPQSKAGSRRGPTADEASGPGLSSITSAEATGRPVRAPVGWLAAASACVLIAFAAVIPSQSRPQVWFVGWGIGGFVSIGLLAIFTVQDSRRRADPWYDSRPVVSYLRTLLVVLAAVAVSLNAWRFADWLSRR